MFCIITLAIGLLDVELEVDDALELLDDDELLDGTVVTRVGGGGMYVGQTTVFGYGMTRVLPTGRKLEL